MSYGQPWTDARTLRAFGECTAQWLEGRIGTMPTSVNYEGVKDETARLVPLLAALNRTGKFITRTSQPGCTPTRRAWGGTMERQRAGVMAFVPPEAVMWVRRALFVDDVVVRVAEPGYRSGHERLLVSRGDGKDATWFGKVLSLGEIADRYGGVIGNPQVPGLHANVIRELQRCYQIVAVDQEWGRNSILWPALKQLV